LKRIFLTVAFVFALPLLAPAQTTGVVRNGTLPGPLPLFPADNNEDVMESVMAKGFQCEA
jgi:hypothetical protein